MTNQRRAILDFLQSGKVHATPEEVYAAVKQKLPRVSKATVYRNLNFLVEKGLIRRLKIKDVACYEAKRDKHHHVICKKCGRIMDFKSDELTSYALSLAKDFEEAEVVSANTIFYGICKNCREVNKNGT